MAIVRNQTTNGNRSVARDPYSLARELLGWDPFFGGRPASAFAPAFEVKETNEAFVIKADIPGVAEKDLDVAVHNGVLTVSGSRQAEERREGESYALYDRIVRLDRALSVNLEDAGAERVLTNPVGVQMDRLRVAFSS